MWNIRLILFIEPAHAYFGRCVNHIIPFKQTEILRVYIKYSLFHLVIAVYVAWTLCADVAASIHLHNIDAKCVLPSSSSSFVRWICVKSVYTEKWNKFSVGVWRLKRANNWNDNINWNENANWRVYRWYKGCHSYFILHIYIHALKSVREMLCKSYDSCCDASSCKRMREMLTKYLYKQHTFTFFRIYKMTPWHSIFTQWLVQVISRRERILLIQFWTKKFNTWNAEQIK